MRLKKIMILLMSAVLVFGSTPFAALAENNNDGEKSDTEPGKYSSKDEAIYGNLDAGGALQDMYVVNTFHVTDPGEITDYGDYTDVRNLSNLNDIEQSNNKVRFQAEGEEFYYQGGMNEKPLPWNIDITYMLDGEEVTPEELTGQSGSLEIQISTSANESVDPVFFENYLLQISLTLDPSKADNIQAPDGTKATSGKNTQVSFTGMPDTAEEFIVTADVTNFEMDPIDISGAPYSMSIENPDISGMKGDMQSLSDAISEIDSGVGDLNSGIADLSAGASDLSSGSSDYKSGINDLNQSSGELVNGSASIRDALNKVNESVQGGAPEAPDLSELEALPSGLRDLASRLRESADGLDTLKENYNNANGSLEEAMNGIPDYQINEETINAIKDQLNEQSGNSADQKKAMDQLFETYQAAQNAKGTYQEVKNAFDSVESTLNNVSNGIREMADKAETTASEIEKGLENMDQMSALKDLQNGLSSLASEYQSFHSGLVEYTDGVGSLASSYGELDSGIQELGNGASSLNSGASELKNGTEQLEERTSDMPGEMQSEVDEMMDEYDASDFEPQSFVSDQNEKVEVVQFVLQTEPIEAKESETAEETDEEEKGFWERLMDLFR
ncbi:hypothetical protein [Lentibacillus amyloliquefaciens]|uniref:X-X-X-Leu-X-X-Gly heptad repeat-containing protein n=1 Tax=Lentibacillus amyloliquefaciens TaxID=1472767 RepID=A0A0U4F264_9BACI|nr:hypothetical protein [Lentibacillus amyloliquefaciens]ALX49591.1 hypothetical protein AOX59_14060 [Lentibacillus amyloliquefaciens]